MTDLVISHSIRHTLVVTAACPPRVKGVSDHRFDEWGSTVAD